MRIRTIEELVPGTLHESPSGGASFLVTGPTGHGKTTTLAALIDEINAKRRITWSPSKTVEYVYKSKSHSAPAAGGHRHATSARRSGVLRQDPDVI